MRSLRWVNVPIPPQHIVGLLIRTYLHIKLSQRLFSHSWIFALVGWPLIAAGVWISLKATLEAGDSNIESPTRLLSTGVYAHSRNPMYIGWTLLHLGLALAVNSLWMLALLPPVTVFTHQVDIRREERNMLDAFGDQYLEYQEQVRGYF